MELDMSRFAEVVREDFSDADLHPSFDVRWGPAGSLTISGGEAHFETRADQGWQDSGLIQGPFGAASGQGYGLYSVEARLDPNQGGGPAVLLWPGTNHWPGPELDILESPDPERQTGYWVVHWRGEGGSDRFDWRTFDTDLTQEHLYQLLWEPGRLTYFLDGEMVHTTTDHVPLPYAEGGENLVIGLQVTAADSYYQPSGVVRLHVDDVSYSVPVEGENASPVVPADSPDAVANSWDLVAAEVQQVYALTGSWDGAAALDHPAFFVASAPDPAVATDAASPIPGPVLGWDDLAARELAWFDLTGTWGAPAAFESEAGLPQSPGSAGTDWDALAAEVSANFDATGAWFA